MMEWFSILTSATSLIAISGALVFATAFWKLHLLVGTPVTLLGMGSSLVSLGIWLIYGMLWCVSMLPYEVMQWFFRIYEFTHLWSGLWIISTVSGATSFLCLAWTLHRGIHPVQPAP